MERKKRRLVGKFGGDRKSDQDLESGLVFLMSKREKQSLCLISMRREQSKVMVQSIVYTKARTCSNQAASNISPVWLCFGVLLTRLTVWAKKGVHHGEETNRWQRMRYLPL